MILYFSATGNSKFAAEKIAEIIHDETVNLLPKLRNNDTSPLYSDKPWVIVCPIYVAEMPQPIENWVRATPLHGNKDIYFVFTAAASMGVAGVMEQRYMKEKGMNYRGSTCIVMPTNYPIFFTVKSESECAEIIRAAVPEIEKAADVIASGGTFCEEKQSRAMVAGTEAVKKLYFSKFIDGNKFYTNGKCIGCGKCSRVCPMCNITMLKNWPMWGNRCMHCMACLSGCPVEAIEYGTKTPGKRKYHFPNLNKTED